MSYNYYFYLADKEDIEFINRSSTIEELEKYFSYKFDKDDPFNCFSLRDITDGLLIELGSDLNKHEVDAITKNGKCERLNWFNQYEQQCFIGDKDMLKRIIEIWNNFVIDQKEKAIKKIQKDHVQEAFHYTRSLYHYFSLVDLDESRPYTVTGSDLFEHAILNLVCMYKRIDWENKAILFVGG